MSTRREKLLLTILPIMVTALVPCYGSDILRVPEDYGTIQEAIDAAQDGQIVLLADAVYSGPGNHQIRLYGKAVTVRSENGPSECIIHCSESGVNCFSLADGEEPNSVIEGLTITSESRTGIVCENSSPLIHRCIFQGHQSALSLARSNAAVQDCVFVNNGQPHDDPRAGRRPVWTIHIQFSSPLLTGCTISQNANGVYANYSKGIIRNCSIIGNGYGVQVAHGRSWPRIVNCTIADNRGSGIRVGTPQANIANTIVWGNAGQQIEGNADVSYSIVERGWPGVGNLNREPRFVRRGYWADPCDHSKVLGPADGNSVWIAGDYRLKTEGWRWDSGRMLWTWDEMTSTAIDAGDPAMGLGDEPLAATIDPSGRYAENVRINMGAYGGTAEASLGPVGWTLRTDVTNDGRVDFHDLSWLTTSGGDGADLNADAFCDCADLALLSSEWLREARRLRDPMWVLPGKATNPAVNRISSNSSAVNLTMSWREGANAVSHDIYLGMAAEELEFRGTRAYTRFSAEGFQRETTYYWRVDEVNGAGKTVGDVWQFRISSR